MQLPVSGATLHLEDWLGPQDAPRVVMLHGGPGADSRYLRPQLDALAHGKSSLQLLYYDQRGSERSPLQPEQIADYHSHVNDLESIRINTQQDKLNLVGYSWGGLLALLYALQHPQRVNQLLLLSPAPTWSEGRKEMKNNLQRANQREDVIRFRENIPQDLAGQDLRQYKFASVVAGYFFDPSLALQLTPFRVAQRVEDAVWGSLGVYDLRPRLHELKHIPTKILHGRQDVIPLSCAEETAKLIGAQLHVFERCGHVSYIEAFDETISLTQEFFYRSTE